MFRALCATLLATTAVVPALSQAGPAEPSQPKYILRSGSVTQCEPGKGCEEELLNGRKYLVMRTDGFILKVASGQDQHHGFADVTITNETGTAQLVNPANFRMEEAEPRLHRLFYIDPNRDLPTPQREPKAAKSELGKGLPSPEYWTSEEHLQEKRVKAVALVTNEPLLRVQSIAPDQTVSGRVYFEHPRAPKGVSLLVALPGALFEFPCRLVNETKSKKHRKEELDAEASEPKS
jgi:hypothetical protein